MYIRIKTWNTVTACSLLSLFCFRILDWVMEAEDLHGCALILLKSIMTPVDLGATDQPLSSPQNDFLVRMACTAAWRAEDEQQAQMTRGTAFLLSITNRIEKGKTNKHRSYITFPNGIAFISSNVYFILWNFIYRQAFRLVFSFCLFLYFQ